MSERHPELIDVLQQVVRSELARVHTSLPGVIESYDATTQTAEVRIPIRFSRRDPDTGERVPYEPPPLPNVPIAWPAGGGGAYSDTWPLQRGDEVWLSFAERSVDEWLLTEGELVTPADVRRFSLSDAVATPVRSRGQLPGDAVASDARVIRGEKVRIGHAEATEALAIAKHVETRLNAIEDYIRTHEHAYIVPAIPASPGPTMKTLVDPTMLIGGSDPNAPSTTSGSTASAITFSL
ncbi:hypothetical protein DL240_09175 [Lujinxingia litoralis]|uniref:Phage protein Gp138 N-terminal domain-containing protein n=1 Tax=Lujinxingia litoralis TaxID=2211119 RepID=A0A328CBZ5_9DELT|nr:Gp138 family membrane-puncturing spike protein [Lujinxingia litoralis]RAL23047.1 hypothetical protein DL240_09175 [Lujinxingia litoralis]